MKEITLHFHNVSIRYESEDDRILSEVSFEIPAGERVALVGLNGSGKTTLLMAIAGLVDREGDISVCGIPVSRHTAHEIRKKIGFLFNVPEDQLLFPTAIEDVAFGLLRQGISREDALEESRKILTALGLSLYAGFPLHHLSHGQKQRVALAGALIANPPLLLLDEPTAGLDPPGKKSLAQFLKRRDAAMLIATHDLDFADELCTRVLFLDKGVIASDTPDTRNLRQIWGMNSWES